MTNKSTPVYILLHQYEYGNTLYKFASDTPKPVGHWWGDLEYDEIVPILQALQIDFEPEKGETIVIELDDQVATYIP